MRLRPPIGKSSVHIKPPWAAGYNRDKDTQGSGAEDNQEPEDNSFPDLDEEDLNEGGTTPPKRIRGRYAAFTEDSTPDEDDSPPLNTTAAKKGTKGYRLTVDIDRQLRARLKIHALRHNTSITGIIEKWIREYTEP